VSLSSWCSGAISLLLLASPNAVEWEEAPWFCHGINCPKFDSVKNMTIDRQSVEIRVYESAMWSATVIANTDLKDAEQTGFQRNFKYITGANCDKKNIDMTSPVLNYIQPAQGPYCTTNFTVSFYVPYAYQPPHDGPPQPSDASVHLQTLEKMTVAVTSFGGHAEQSVVIAKAAELSQLLSGSGLKFDEENWYFAGYDDPFRLTNRHNEIWIKLIDYPNDEESS